VSGRDLKIKFSLGDSPAALSPTSDHADAGRNRPSAVRARDTLIALARLLARHAARQLTSPE
jgi:hypothetical protein